MIFKLYSVKDELSGYAPAIPWVSEELALRDFIVTMQNNPRYMYTPGDYNLYYMGTFDSESGTYIQEKGITPRLVKKGVEVINGKIDNTL